MDDNYGLHVIYPPAGQETGSDVQIDLVFVHGLGGHPFKTWKHEASESPWISNPSFLSTLTTRVRAMTFGYNANVFKKVATTTINDHANDLLEDLVVKRRGTESRPLIFVAHSLGGLVVKDALLLSPDDDRYENIRKMTRGIIFLGTPHNGSDHPENLAIMQKLYAWATWSSDASTRLTAELKSNSDMVMRLNQSFMRNISKSIELVCFFETHPTPLPSLKGAELIVPQHSAQIHGNGARNITMACTHTELSKFAQPTESRFLRFKDQLETVILNILRHAESEAIASQGNAADREARREEDMSLARFAQLSPPRDDLQERQYLQSIEHPNQRSDEFQFATSQYAPPLQKPWLEREKRADEDRKNLFLSSLAGWTDANHGYTGHDAHGPRPGTCKWISKHPTFQAWLYGSVSSLLFITGMAGCGKSFLAKFLRDHFESLEDDDYFTVPYFCNNTVNDRNEPPILHFFVHELLSRQPALFGHVNSKYWDNVKLGSSLLTAALVDILKGILPNLKTGKIILIIDGLDECDSKYSVQLLQEFHWMLEENGPDHIRAQNHLRILITCREEKGIETWVPIHRHIRVTPEEVKADISKYVQSEMTRISHSKVFHDISPNFVASRIESSSSGLFLWVRHVIKDIESLPVISRDAVVQIVSSCPRDMKKYYEQALAKMDDETSIDIRAILKILVFAARPMKMSELLEASRIFLQVDLEHGDLSCQLRDKCSRLIRLGAGGEIELFHHSLRECLAEGYDRSDGQLMLAVICLKYLCNKTFERIPACILNVDYKAEIKEKLIADFPFLDYASMNLGYHIRESADLVEGALPYLRPFLSTSSVFFRTWDYVYDWLGGTKKVVPTPPTSVLCTLSYWNAVNLIHRVYLRQEFAVYGLFQQFHHTWEWLLYSWKFSTPFQISENCTAVGKDGATMLHYACSNGHVEFVHFHLAHCPHVDMKDRLGHHPIHLATEHPDILTLLISAGAQVEVADSDGWTPLMFAVSKDAYESAEILLRKGANANSQCTAGTTALELAVDEDSATMINLLFEFGANADQPFSDGPRPISIALRNQKSKAFGTLLDRVTLGSEYESLSADLLCSAVLSGRTDYVEMLLDKAVDPDVILLEGKHFTYRSLMFALFFRFPDVAKVLLLKGASPELGFSDGTTPLHQAAAAGYFEVCELILDLGGDINAIDQDKQTPLSRAVLRRHEGIVDLLIQNHADAAVQDRLGAKSPLHVAVRYGLTAAVKSILSCQARPDINSFSQDVATPLGLACASGHHEIVELLITEGADIDKPNSHGSSPLKRAVQENHREVVITLLEHNAQLHAPGEKWTALHLCAAEGNVEIMKMLLERWDPSDIDVRSENGTTALYQACNNGHYEVASALLAHNAQATITMSEWSIFLASCLGGDMKTFLDIQTVTGSSIDEPGYNDWTPLMCACWRGHVKLIEYLLLHGADISRRNKYGSQPLHLTIRSNCSNKVEAIRLLLDHVEGQGTGVAHAIINSLGPGRTPLYLACQAGNLEVTKLLLERQADPMLKDDEYDWVPLSRSCWLGHAKIVSELLDSPRGDPLQLDFKHRNCLHFSLTSFRKELVSLIFSKLLSRGAILEQLLDQKDLFGRTPFEYATVDFPRLENDMSRASSSITQHRRGIREIVLDIKSGYKEMDMRFYVLGKRLIFVGDDKNAIFAYQRRINWSQDDSEGTLEHKAWCDSCDVNSNIRSSRYVCRTCVDIDLCEKCHENYNLGIYSDRTCRSHKFLCVPITTFSEKEGNTTAAIFDRHQIDAWLADLEERYSINALPRAGTDLSEDPEEPGNSLKVLALPQRLACLSFRTSLLGFSLPPNPISLQGLELYKAAEDEDHLPLHMHGEVD